MPGMALVGGEHSTEIDAPRTCPVCHGPRHMAGSFAPPVDPQRWWCNPECPEWGTRVTPPGEGHDAARGGSRLPHE